jgi:hypothetical protein
MVQLFGPGIKKPCDVVQQTFSTTASGGNLLAITPTSAINLVHIVTSGSASVSATSIGQWIYSAVLKRGSTSLETVTGVQFPSGTGVIESGFSHDWLDAPVTTAPTTYSTVASGSAGAGLGQNTIRLEEIMGALDPMSDNNAGLGAPAKVA